MSFHRTLAQLKIIFMSSLILDSQRAASIAAILAALKQNRSDSFRRVAGIKSMPSIFSVSKRRVLFTTRRNLSYVLLRSSAQRLHLIPAVPPPLSDDEWRLVKERSAHRRDFQRPCAICKEELGIRSQVLLSCSHTFHKVCLQAFEHFSGRKCCPLCRYEEYQARVVHEGTHWYRVRCATRIQALWRGYFARRQYKQKIVALLPKDMYLQRKLHEEKLCALSDQLLQRYETGADQLLEAVDHSVAIYRSLLGQLDAPIGRDDWEKIQFKALRREVVDCPICLTGLTSTTDAESTSDHSPVVLLSCSHLFHGICLQTFETCGDGGLRLCPVCRSTYVKQEFSPSGHLSFPIDRHNTYQTDNSAV
uniref:RING finger protein 32 n=1 Tax=Myxine glutinosa TaxID=7769 RepID=UPI00358E83CB